MGSTGRAEYKSGGTISVTIYTDGFNLESLDKDVGKYGSSFGEYLGAKAGQAIFEGPTAQAIGIAELGNALADRPSPSLDDGMQAGLDYPGIVRPADAKVPSSVARERVKAEGLDKVLKIPDGDINTRALDIMINRARERHEREATVARGPDGLGAGALGVGTSFLVGALDPLNVATAFVPVVGELRYAKMMADAGGLAGRTGVRAATGAGSGAVGMAALQPLEAYAASQEGRDFTFVQALQNIGFGAALGGALHTGGGLLSDTIRARQGRPQYPYDIGEPHEYHTPWADLQRPRPVEPSILPETIPSVSPTVAAIQDLPPRAREDALRGAIANLVDGEPVRVGEMLDVAARHDPRIAESLALIDAYHGSPHTFDRFDITRIGTGEGAQSFGHGLYFAERESIARHYQKTTTEQDFIRKAQELYNEFDSPSDAHAELAASKDFTPGQKRLLDALERDDWLGFDYPHQAVRAALREAKNFPDISAETKAAIAEVGNLYKVRIKADKEHFLDWDKPLAEQPPNVQAALANLGIDQSTATSGADAYQQLTTMLSRRAEPDAMGMRRQVGQADASKALAAAGVPGIRYLDQASRGKAEGSRNFVVFDDKAVEIVSRNGEPRAAAPEPNSAQDFHALARVKEDPDVIAASKAAEEAPDLVTMTPDKRVTEARKSLTEAEAEYRQAEANMPEDVRIKSEAEYKDVAERAADEEMLIAKGAECLARGAGGTAIGAAFGAGAVIAGLSASPSSAQAVRSVEFQRDNTGKIASAVETSPLRNLNFQRDENGQITGVVETTPMLKINFKRDETGRITSAVETF
jgi:hypothetical protein